MVLQHFARNSKGKCQFRIFPVRDTNSRSMTTKARRGLRIFVISTTKSTYVSLACLNTRILQQSCVYCYVRAIWNCEYFEINIYVAYIFLLFLQRSRVIMTATYEWCIWLQKPPTSFFVNLTGLFSPHAITVTKSHDFVMSTFPAIDVVSITFP